MNILLLALGRGWLFVQSDIIGLEVPDSHQDASVDVLVLHVHCSHELCTDANQSVSDCVVDRE